jgi:hypothetical protein
MQKEDEKGLGESDKSPGRSEGSQILSKIIEQLREAAKRGQERPLAPQNPKQEKKMRVKKEGTLFHRLKEKFDQAALERYNKPYEELNTQEKIQILSRVLPENPQHEAAKRTKAQVDKVKSDLEIPEEGEVQQEEWKLDKRRKFREIGKTLAQQQEDPTTTPFLHRQKPEGVTDEEWEKEEEAMIIADELRNVLYEEAKHEVAREYIARGLAAQLEINSIFDTASEDRQKAQDRVGQLMARLQGSTEEQDTVYEQLVERYKEQIEQELQSLSREDIEEIVELTEKATPRAFDQLDDDFKLYAQDVRQSQEDYPQGDVPERYRDMTEEELIDHIDNILDLIEERSEFVRELQFDYAYQELRREIALIKQYALPNSPQRRMELEDRINTILAMHDMNLGLTKPPFDEEKLRVIKAGASDLLLKELYKEATRSIAGVDAPIAKTAHYAEVALAELIHAKGNHRFEQSDIPVLIQKLHTFVEQLYEGKEINSQLKARIVRRADRLFTVSLRKALVIARESELPEDLTRYENDPFGSIIALWRPSYWVQQKWGTISHEEQDILYKAIGGPDELDQIMADFNDPYTGFRIHRYLQALDEAGYHHAGLWMRIIEPGDSPEVFARRKRAFEHLLHEDTHMLPLLTLYKDDPAMLGILRDGGFGDFSDFEEKLSIPLYMKLQNQLETPQMTYQPEKMPPGHRQQLESHDGTIKRLLAFLQEKEHDIQHKLHLQFEPSDGHHGESAHQGSGRPNYLWQKTISTADIPIRALERYLPLSLQKDYWARVFTGDLANMYGIAQDVNYFARNPQDLSKLAKIISDLENQGGREGAQEKLKKLLKGMLKLNQPKWYAQWLPEWLIDLTPGLYASEMQKIRGKSLSAWNLTQRLEMMHRLEMMGIITPENEHYYKELLKVRLGDRVIPTLKFMFVLGIASMFLIVLAQAKEEFSGQGSGGHH